MSDAIHLRHYLDGYPLCWPMDKVEPFSGTHEAEEVTCGACWEKVVQFQEDFDE